MLSAALILAKAKAALSTRSGVSSCSFERKPATRSLRARSSASTSAAGAASPAFRAPMTSAKVALSRGLRTRSPWPRTCDVAAVDAARRVRAHDLLRLLDLDRHVPLRAVGEGVLLEDQRLIDRREDG